MRLLIVLGVAVAGLAVALVVMLRQPAPPASSPRVADGAATVRSAIAADAALAPVPIVIDATARADREEAIATLRRSGPGVELWDDQGLALLASFSRGGAEIRDSACFIAGCGATFTFSSEADYHRRLDELASSALYRAWTGGKRLTSPEVFTDGRVSVALLLYRPD